MMRRVALVASVLCVLVVSVLAQLELPVVSDDGSTTTTVTLSLPSSRAPLLPNQIPQISQIQQADARVKAAIVATDTQAKQLFLKIKSNSTSAADKATLYAQLQDLKTRMQSLLALHMRLQSLKTNVFPEWAFQKNACPTGWQNLGFSFKERRVYCRPAKGATPPGNPTCNRIFRFPESYDRCGFAKQCQVDWSAFNCPPPQVQSQQKLTQSVPVPAWIVKTKLKFVRARRSVSASISVQLSQTVRHATITYRLAIRRLSRARSPAARSVAKKFVSVARAQVQAARAYSRFLRSSSAASRQRALAIFIRAQRRAARAAAAAIRRQLRRAKAAYRRATSEAQRQRARMALIRVLKARSALVAVAHYQQQLLRAGSKQEMKQALRDLVTANRKLSSAMRRAISPNSVVVLPATVLRPLTELEKLKLQVAALAVGQQRLFQLISELKQGRKQLRSKVNGRLHARRQAINKLVARLQAQKRKATPRQRRQIAKIQRGLKLMARLSAASAKASAKNLRYASARAAMLAKHFHRQAQKSTGAARRAALQSYRAALKTRAAIHAKLHERKAKRYTQRRVNRVVRALRAQYRQAVDPRVRTKLRTTLRALRAFGPQPTRSSLRARRLRASSRRWNSRAQRARKARAAARSADQKKLLKLSQKITFVEFRMLQLTTQLAALKAAPASPKNSAKISSIQAKVNKLKHQRIELSARRKIIRKQASLRVQRKQKLLKKQTQILARRLEQLSSSPDANPKVVAALAARVQKLRQAQRAIKAHALEMKRQRAKQTARFLVANIKRLEKAIESMKKSGTAAKDLAPIEAKLDRYISKLADVRKKVAALTPKPAKLAVSEKIQLLKRAIARTQKRIKLLGPNAPPAVVKALQMKLITQQATQASLNSDKKLMKKQQRADQLKQLADLAQEIHKLYDQLTTLEDEQADQGSINKLNAKIASLKKQYRRLYALLYPKRRSIFTRAHLYRVNQRIDATENALEEQLDADEPDQIEVDRLNRRLARLKKRRVMIKEKLRAQRRVRVARAKSRVERVRARITEVREAIAQAKDDAETTPDELAKLQAKLRRLVNKESVLVARWERLKAIARKPVTAAKPKASTTRLLSKLPAAAAKWWKRSSSTPRKRLSTAASKRTARRKAAQRKARKPLRKAHQAARKARKAAHKAKARLAARKAARKAKARKAARKAKAHKAARKAKARKAARKAKARKAKARKAKARRDGSSGNKKNKKNRRRNLVQDWWAQPADSRRNSVEQWWDTPQRAENLLR